MERVTEEDLEDDVLLNDVRNSDYSLNHKG